MVPGPRHAVGTASRPGRKGFEGNPVCRTSGRRCSRIVAHRRLAEVVRIGQVADRRQLVGIRSGEVEVRPSGVASCAVVHSLADLGLEMCLDRS